MFPEHLWPGSRLGPWTHLTDEDLVVELVCVLTESIGHVGNPVPQVVHAVLTASSAGSNTAVRTQD